MNTKKIELDNIVLYDLEGKPEITYKKVIFDIRSVRERYHENLERSARKTTPEWATYYQRHRRSRKIAPSLPLLYAIIERMQETNHPRKDEWFNEMRKEEGYLCTSTRINFKANKITHNYGFSPWEVSFNLPFETPFEIPQGGMNFGTIKTSIYIKRKERSDWKKTLQALLMPKDITYAMKTLKQFGWNKEPVLDLPSDHSRFSYRPEAPILFLIGKYGDIGIDAVSDWSSYSLGVTLKK